MIITTMTIASSAAKIPTVVLEMITTGEGAVGTREQYENNYCGNRIITHLS